MVKACVCSPLLAVVVGLLACWPASAVVQQTLSPECRRFLYLGREPAGLEDHSLVKICQFYKRKARYVTLYNTKDHVPVYSAYTFKSSDGEQKVDVPWMYEPQLSTSVDVGDMQPFLHDTMHQNFENTQAVLEDYANTVLYDRGHLNPDEHQATSDDKAATYTLTNVVPQVCGFHRGPWRAQEHAIRRRLNNYCRGTAYVVTGITTSGSMIRRDTVDRVAVPTHLWSAYCCIDYDHNAPYNERYKFPAFAHYGLNDKENNEIVELSVPKLEDFLKKTTFVDKNFQIFAEQCVLPGTTMS
ncbi:endonuclease domain-containing 1 protein-like [Brachyhypopomus gauderio]|uniref:endonuclease domain-containing 1 protein-like n=1 Tax=Brachyhypopomus gauderio TaxID=698409 RepID=UPI004041DDC7